MRTLLLLAAVIPPLFLMRKIYRIDKVEREPLGLVAKLFFFGILITIPAGYIESFLERLLGVIASEKSLMYRLVSNFLIVAWAEEGLKHFALKRGSWRNTAFDYRFDAIVYSVAVALGFAAFENIGYVFSYGLANALGRAVTAVPAHCICGIFMGYYYGTAKYFAVRKGWKRESFYQFLSLFIPILIHGFYDFAATSGSNGTSAVFLMYIIAMDVVAYITVLRMSKNDMRLRRYDTNV
ncbi:MAG: PrsW family glutamic-type intramembrane protease [Hornefia sp.]|nr:PrsW family glutamic-type intramembrane protease [Hornefia sp.]